MSKKKTYANMMRTLSNKKATYQKGLAEAQRMGNSAGIADYERRLAKIAAGMDELFMAQEKQKPAASVMPPAASMYGEPATIDGGDDYMYGGNTKKKSYELGGNTTVPERAVRNNNPGNLVAVGDQPRDDRGFRIFDTPQDGLVALVKQLNLYKTGKTRATWKNDDGEAFKIGPDTTLEQAMRAYAPFGDGTNNPVEYAKFIAERLGVDPTIPIGNLDDILMNQWAESISRMESPEMYEQLYGPVEERDAANSQRVNRLEEARRQRHNERLEQAGNPEAAPVRIPADGSQPGAYVDEDGFYQILTDQNGMRRYVTPGMQKHIENGTFGYMMNQGRYDNPDDAIFYEGGTLAQPGGTVVTTPTVTPPIVETPPVVTPPAPAPAPRVASEEIIPAAAPPAMGSIPTDIGAPLQARSIESGMAPQLRTADASGGYTPGDVTLPTKSHSGFLTGLNEVGGMLKQNLGTIVGTGLGLMQDKANMRAIEEMQGPIAAPMRDKGIYTPMQTDFMVGNQLNAIQQESARTAAAIQEAGGSPQLQAAMQRARQRTAAGQTANILANEQQQELGLRNQNLQNINNLLNQNLDIDFQNRTTDMMNRQRTLDFENERMAARNRIRQDMANRLGAAGQEIASRAADRRRWELVSKMDQYGVIGRNDINPLG